MSVVLTPETVKRISELSGSEVLGGFDREGNNYTAGRDEEHIRINVSVDAKALLEVIDRQLVHEEGQVNTINYQRGFIKGLRWTRTEICKAFGV